MVAIGAGGIDVAVAMGGGAYNIAWPKVVGIRLTGQLTPGVSAKDVILAVLRRFGYVRFIKPNAITNANTFFIIFTLLILSFV